MSKQFESPVRTFEFEGAFYHILITPVGDEWHSILTAQYDHLVEAFGESTINGYSDKIDAEWYIAGDYDIARLYNWKNGRAYLGDAGPATENVTVWQIRTRKLKTIDEVLSRIGK